MQVQLSRDTILLTEVDLTRADSTEWRAQLDAALGGARRNIEVDLSRTHALDSRGLGVLAVLHKTAQRHDAVCRLLNPAPPVRQILELARMNKVFQVTSAQAD